MYVGIPVVRKALSETRFHEQYLIICIQSQRGPGTLPSPRARQAQITMNFSQQANVSLLLPPRPLPVPSRFYPATSPAPSLSSPAPSSPLHSLSPRAHVITTMTARRLTGSRRISGNRLIKREECTTWLIHTVGDL